MSSRVRLAIRRGLFLLVVVGCASNDEPTGCDTATGPYVDGDWGGIGPLDFPPFPTSTWTERFIAGSEVDTTRWAVHGDSVSTVWGVRIASDGRWQDGLEGRVTFDRSEVGGQVTVSGLIGHPESTVRSIGFVQLQGEWGPDAAESDYLEFRFNDESAGDHRIYYGSRRDGMQVRHELIAMLPERDSTRPWISWRLNLTDAAFDAWYESRWVSEQSVVRSPFVINLHVDTGAIPFLRLDVSHYSAEKLLPCPAPMVHGWIVGTVLSPAGAPMPLAAIDYSIPELDSLKYGRTWESAYCFVWSQLSQYPTRTNQDGEYSMYYSARLRPEDANDYDLRLEMTGRFQDWDLSQPMIVPMATSRSYETPDTVQYDISFALADTVPSSN